MGNIFIGEAVQHRAHHIAVHRAGGRGYPRRAAARKQRRKTGAYTLRETVEAFAPFYRPVGGCEPGGIVGIVVEIRIGTPLKDAERTFGERRGEIVGGASVNQLKRLCAALQRR